MDYRFPGLCRRHSGRQALLERYPQNSYEQPAEMTAKDIGSNLVIHPFPSNLF